MQAQRERLRKDVEPYIPLAEARGLTALTNKDAPNPLTRKRGPRPGPPTQQYALMLEAEPAEWAKGMPGGLSQFLRKLLREAYEHRGGSLPDPMRGSV